MTLTIKEIESKAKQIRDLERLIEEAQTEAETLKDQIKAEMGEDEILVAGEYKITYTSVTSVRLDTTALKKAFSAEILAPYSKTSVSRRFSIK